MEDWSKYDLKFRYRMLDRLRQDCYYSLNYFDGSENVLFENMVALWKTFEPEDRPEWLTWDDIMSFAHRFGVDIKIELTPVHYFRKNREDEE